MTQNTKSIHISELEQDKRNANRGTERGAYMLESSFRQFGAGRSILIDKHGRIIAGNKSAEQAAALGLDDVIVVESDGKKLIAVQRTDLDLYEDEAARKLAYYDNRASQVGLDFDPAIVFEDLQAGLDLSAMFRQDELDELLAGMNDDGAETTTTEQARATLAERFLIPPFSVLDARQGYWQARKSAWIALGIQSELGRGENALDMSAAMAGITDPMQRKAKYDER